MNIFISNLSIVITLKLLTILVSAILFLRVNFLFPAFFLLKDEIFSMFSYSSVYFLAFLTQFL
jgi:hypothetical protein